MFCEWDSKKAEKNLEKHSVSFQEAASIFQDPLELTISDPDHSVGEFRYISIGMSSSDRILVVSYTERGNSIRIISAREATRSERKQYEKGQDEG